MSGKQVGKVLASVLSGAELIVAVVLADHAHVDGSHCFPGLNLIIHESKLGRSTVLRALKRFEEMGWIKRVSDRAPGRPTEYQLHFDAAPRWADQNEVEKGPTAGPHKVPQRDLIRSQSRRHEVPMTTPENETTPYRPIDNLSRESGGFLEPLGEPRASAREPTKNGLTASRENGTASETPPKRENPATAQRLRDTAAAMGIETNGVPVSVVENVVLAGVTGFIDEPTGRPPPAAVWRLPLVRQAIAGSNAMALNLSNAMADLAKFTATTRKPSEHLTDYAARVCSDYAAFLAANQAEIESKRLSRAAASEGQP